MFWKGKIVSCILITLVCFLTLTAIQRSVANIEGREGRGMSCQKIQAVKIQTPPKIDGDISDPIWDLTPWLGGHLIDRDTGKPQEDETYMKLLYDDRAIYAAFKIHESQPDKIVAQVTEDGSWAMLDNDDIIYIAFDLYLNSTDIDWFAANYLGKGVCHLHQGAAQKVEWRGLWQAEVKITGTIIYAEFLIPWQMLDYPNTDNPLTIGVCFSLIQRRTANYASWPPIGATEDFTKMARLLGVKAPRKKRSLKVLSYAYAGRTEEEGELTAGISARYRLAHELISVLTVNPDWTNVQQEVERIDLEYGGSRYKDARPFFQEGGGAIEGSGQRGLGNLFYSRTIEKVDAGVKGFGKPHKHTTVGGFATFYRGGRHNVLLRAEQLLPAHSNIGAAFLRNKEGSLSNSVLFLTGGQKIGKGEWQANFAQTRKEGDWTGRQINARIIFHPLRLSLYSIDEDFVNKLGFHPFTGIRGGKLYADKDFKWQWGFIRHIFLVGIGEWSKKLDGSIFRRTAYFQGWLATPWDQGFLFSVSAGDYEQNRDWTFRLMAIDRISDRKTNYGSTISWGRRAGKRLFMLEPSGSLQLGPLTTSLKVQMLRYEPDEQLYIWSINYEGLPFGFNLGARMVWRVVGEETYKNVYCALRRGMPSIGGTEIYLIIGEPNSREFKRRLVGKIVFPID